MIGFAVERLVQALLTLFTISLIVFALSRATGSPVDLLLPADATEEDVAQIEERLGLHRSLPEQYLYFVKDGMTNGFGQSLRFRVDTAAEVVQDRVAPTFYLAGFALGLVLVVGTPLGILSAIYRGTMIDLSVRVLMTLVQATPLFLVALLAIRVISVEYGLLPTSGYGVKESILPASILAMSAMPGVVRLLRSSTIGALSSEYVRFARIKGVPEPVVILKHAVLNALVAPLTFFGTLAALFLTGTVVTETIFAWPGLGSLAVASVRSRDFPVVQAIILFFALIFVVVNFIVDVLYAMVDPRIRYWK
jgi:peptide/nickel transport system permease protein